MFNWSKSVNILHIVNFLLFAVYNPLYMTTAEAKYALVDFLQRDEVDIVETKDIVTNVTCSKLNAKEWNGTTQVQVIWFPDGAIGKNPPKKYKYYALKVCIR